MGVEVTVEEAKAAARYTAINALGMIRYALGSLDNVVGMSPALCFVACRAGFTQLHEVSNGVNELFLDVFGEEILECAP